jgi:hypothetical protein
MGKVAYANVSRIRWMKAAPAQSEMGSAAQTMATVTSLKEFANAMRGLVAGTAPQQSLSHQLLSNVQRTCLESNALVEETVMERQANASASRMALERIAPAL